MTPERRALLAMAACAALIACLGQWTDIDMRLATAMYHAPSGTFPMRHSWLGETFSHVVLKALLVSLALAVCLLVACDVARPCCLLSHRIRLRLRLVALSSLLVPLVTAVLKRASSSHCPWDLAAFGGSQTYVRLFDTAILGAPAGHCMPAGHASSALWLVAVAGFWLPHRPRTACGVGVMALASGFWLGWMQQLRGAHFLTHTLWSMWIACATVAVLYAALGIRSGAAKRAPAGVDRRTRQGRFVKPFPQQFLTGAPRSDASCAVAPDTNPRATDPGFAATRRGH